MRDPQSLDRRDLPRDTIALARFLIGTTLVGAAENGTCVARIVETEAYLPDDAASHAFRGRTGRNAAMFGDLGCAYVYFIYGAWYCLNVVSEARGVGGAVLLRAAEPLAGLELMRVRRGERPDLCRGPGRLAQAFGISRLHDGLDLCEPGPLRLGAPSATRGPIGTSRRIGLTKEVDRPLRFFERGNAFVSGPISLNR